MNMITSKPVPVDSITQEGTPLTLDDLITRVRTDPDLTLTRRRDLASSLRRLCILLGLDPANEPASAAHLRGLLALVSPHQAQIADKTLKNMRANIGFVLRRYQPRMALGQMGLSPQWQHLRHALPQGQLRYRLSRFIRFCSGE